MLILKVDVISLMKGNDRMIKTIIVINGRGGVGKDTCVEAVATKYTVLNCSSITPIKQAADILRWNFNDKSDKARKFLSDLKMLSSEFNNYPFVYLLEMYKYFITSSSNVMFVHIREPEEIAKFKERVPECKTLLIKSNRTERNYGNVADDGVDNYDYDFIYHNDKPLDEVKDDFLNFFEKQIVEDRSEI